MHANAAASRRALTSPGSETFLLVGVEKRARFLAAHLPA